MSLFDAIKYPISDKPTVEQLAALPEKIFNKWIAGTNWRTFNLTPNEIAIWYSTYSDTFLFDNRDAAEIRLLKQLIAEWDSNEFV